MLNICQAQMGDWGDIEESSQGWQMDNRGQRTGRTGKNAKNSQWGQAGIGTWLGPKLGWSSQFLWPVEMVT